jgi:hypothetical protein
MGVMVYFLTYEKINTNPYYESDSLNARNSNTICEYMMLQDDKCILLLYILEQRSS